jgi:hypothetical protein
MSKSCRTEKGKEGQLKEEHEKRSLFKSWRWKNLLVPCEEINENMSCCHAMEAMQATDTIDDSPFVSS